MTGDGSGPSSIWGPGSPGSSSVLSWSSDDGDVGVRLVREHDGTWSVYRRPQHEEATAPEDLHHGWYLATNCEGTDAGQAEAHEWAKRLGSEWRRSTRVPTAVAPVSMAEASGRGWSAPILEGPWEIHCGDGTVFRLEQVPGRMAVHLSWSGGPAGSGGNTYVDLGLALATAKRSAAAHGGIVHAAAATSPRA